MMQAIDRWLMAPTPATRIGVLRFVLCAYLLADRVRGEVTTLFASMERPIAFMDPSLAVHLPIPYPMPSDWRTPFAVLFHVACIFAALGLFTRASLACFTLMYLYAGSVNSSWGFFNHTPAIAVQVLIALTLIPGTTSWSLDRAIVWWWRRRRARAAAVGNANEPSWREALRGPDVPRYALNIIVGIMIAVYMATGIAKVRMSGVEWLAGDTLEYSLLSKGDHKRGQLYIGDAHAPPEQTWRDGYGVAHWVYRAPSTALGRAVGKLKPVVVALAVFTMLFELLAPLALIGPRARTIYFLLALLFHAGILATMWIPFTAWMVIDVCLIEWRLAWSWLRTRMARARRRLA